jgi:hypothetical protein
MTLSSLFESFFTEQKNLARLDPDFHKDFSDWYEDAGGADVLEHPNQGHLSPSEMNSICTHITNTWFANKETIWATVLGHLISVIYELLQLDSNCLATLRNTIGSYLNKQGIAPWWDNPAVLGIFISDARNSVLSIS